MIHNRQSNKLPVQFCPAKYSSRSGLSLLEVILAIAILGGALVVILNLNYLGNRSAGNAKAYSEAQILCDTKMAEIAAGVLPLESLSGGSIPDRPEWVYSVDVQQAEHIGLMHVTVMVQQSPSLTSNPTPVTLMRLVPDPDYEPEQDILQ